MKKAISWILALYLVLIPGCSDQAADTGQDLQILTTTYPVYIFASHVARGVEGVRVELMADRQLSSLHDYTLSANDMTEIDNADVIIINGCGLEQFPDSAPLSGKTVVDSSEGVQLLSGKEGPDPHIWLDPNNAAVMVRNIGDALAAIDPDHEGNYAQNAETYGHELMDYAVTLKSRLEDLENRQLIIFDDSFEYFARAFDLTILKSIEGEASEIEIAEIAELIRGNGIPSIFIEINGDTAAAEAVSRETGVDVYALDMIMSGDFDIEDGDGYFIKMTENVSTLIVALK